jgi:CPA2 family monovalent cation:H+ antiporter-2
MAELITTLTIMFGAAAIGLLTSIKFEHPAIPLYILSGLAISPFISQDQILYLSQVGISFLVFIYGVRFSTGKLKSVASDGIAASATSITLTAAAASTIAYLLGMNLIETAVFASAAALSSSLVGLELVRDDLRKELVHGRIIESIQLIQDLAAVLIILILFSQNPSTALIKGLTLLGAAFLIKQAIPYLAEGFRDSTEAIMIFSLAMLAIFISVTRFLQISAVIGAFAAGIALSKYPYRIEVIDTVGTLKDFFTALLFVSIGGLAATTNIQVAQLAATITILTVIVKPVITYTTFRLLGRDSRISFLSSLGLDQVSEFALIIAIQAFIANQITQPLLQSIILATAFTMALSSYTSKYEHKIYQKTSKLLKIEEKIESTVENPESHIILVGYDTQGQNILEELKDQHEVTVIEYDPEKIPLIDKKAGYVFGDVMHDASWEEANYTKADLIISTVPLRHVSGQILSLETDADKILRTPHINQAEKLHERGAIFVSIPKILASQRMIDHIEGAINNPNYRHQLRRKNLLKLRKQQSQ